MSISDTFFEALEKRILEGEKLGAMKNFLIDARDRFLALERDAQAQNNKGKNKALEAALAEAETENQRKDAIINELRQEMEKTAFDKAQVRKGSVAQAATEKALEDANEEIVRLKEEIARLAGQNEILIRQRNEGKGDGQANGPKDAAELPETALKMLTALKNSNQPLGEGTIAVASESTAIMAIHFTQEMERAGFVRRVYFPEGTFQGWAITFGGTAFLEKAIGEEKKQAHNTEELPKEQVEILRVLSTGIRHTMADIAGSLQMGAEVAKYHVHELLEAKMIIANNYMGRPTDYQLIQPGRTYLMKRGELK